MTRTITRAEIVERRAELTVVETLRGEHFDSGHIPGAVHLGMDDVEARAATLLPDRDAPIVTYCSNRACANSRVVAEKLARLGYTDVRRYEEGKQDWAEAGLDLEVGAVPV